MRPGNNARRPRGRPNRKQHGSPRAHTYDSHGPDVRIRGNAPQIYEKYVTLARDATASGDRIAAEGYYQFAEHYFRIMNDSTDPRRPAPQAPRPEAERPASDSVPALADQEQPQVEWPVEPDAANGGAGEAAEQTAEQSAEPVAAAPKAAEEEKPLRPSKGRPRGRRRAANGAKDPAAAPAAKLAEEADGAADGASEEAGPAEKTDKGESVNP